VKRALQTLLILLSITLNVVCVRWLVYRMQPDQYKEVSFMKGLFDSATTSSRNKCEKRIAILVPSSAKVVLEIVDGFKDTLYSLGLDSCEYKLYNGNGQRSLIPSQVEDILQSRYDLVFSLGMQATTTLKELSDKHNASIPVVFVSVKDPVGLGIIASEKSSGNNFTGIAAGEDYGLQAMLLCKIKKNLRNVLIAYDPTQLGGYTTEERRLLEIELVKHNLNVKGVEVFESDKVVDDVKPFLDTTDVLIILRDHTTMSAVQALSKVCSQYGVTLFASDLDSVDCGAVLGFGYHEYDSGVMAARKAFEVLYNGRKPTDIPIESAVKGYRVRVNTAKLKEQNLVIDPNIFFLMTNGEVV